MPHSPRGPAAETGRCSPSPRKPGCGSARSPGCASPASTSAPAPHVACTGKGRKRRTTPLTTATTNVLTGYLHERKNRPGDALFPNPQGQALSPDAVQQRLSVYVARAQTACPELADKTITVHTLRHTAAMRFLEAGIDTAVIALWLGHESLATTSMYLHADLNIKRAALERTRQPDTPAGDYHPDDPLLTWLQSL
ncbi:tyrosine-type recombinase/integrase [Nostocoides sp.]|uniref:tyrosine-type recombinase/integrase n=1 Tax=Nostocoides sp. TaxID=1917966 RepID=UPI003C761AB5